MNTTSQRLCASARQLAAKRLNFAEIRTQNAGLKYPRKVVGSFRIALRRCRARDKVNVWFALLILYFRNSRAEMKLTILISALVLSMSGFCLGQDAEKLPEDAAQLRSTYQELVERAAKPIRDRYVADLKRLLEQYTRAGKLDQALAIRHEIESMESRTPVDPGETVEQFQHKLEGTTWLWNDDPKGKFIFLSDGQTKGWSKFKWTVTKPYVVESDKGTIEFDHGLLKGTAHEVGGKGVIPLKRVKD
jgi:hypothetical protein